jgi:hypothetical protein
VDDERPATEMDSDAQSESDLAVNVADEIFIPAD